MGQTPTANAPTGTYLTAAVVGLREDLSNIVDRIDPDETPIKSGMKAVAPKAIRHDWLNQELKAVDTANRQYEGYDLVILPVKPRDLYSNYTQILSTNFSISHTTEAVDAAGVDSEIAEQKILCGLENRRDLDGILAMDQASAGTDPRGLGAMSSWFTNGTVGATGAMPTGDGTDLPTAGTPAPLTLAMIDEGQKEAYEAGGRPTVMYMNTNQKVAFSALHAGGAADNRLTMTANNPVDAKIIGSVDMYLSDFGTLTCAVDLWMPQDRIYGIDRNYISCGALPGQNMSSYVLAKTGASTKWMIEWEGTLKVNAPKAHWQVLDLT